MNHSIREDVVQAARLVHAEVRELKPAERDRIWALVAGRFAVTGRAVPRFLWEDVQGAAAVQDPEAWRWIADYAARRSEPAILFFNPADESAMFTFKDGAQVVPVLEETPSFEFYLTDPDVTYLLCFNHHDFLIAAGEAAAWLERHTTASARS